MKIEVDNGEPMNYELLQYLEQQPNQYISGEELAQKFSQTRSNIWKQIQIIRKKGFEIVSSTNRGYAFKHYHHAITPYQIQKLVKEPLDVLLFDHLASTNTYIKQHHLDLKTPTLVVADTQSGGKGRFERSFFSYKGGIYLSLFIKKAFPLVYGNYLTIMAGLAVVKTIEQLYQVTPSIKWQNDVFLNNKKICGILCEGGLHLETQLYDYVIIGIGVNLLDTSFPSNLEDIATSLETETGITIERGTFIGVLLHYFNQFLHQLQQNNLSFMEDYKAYNFLLQKKIKIRNQPDVYRVLDIDQEGYLVVQNLRTKNITKNGSEVSIYEIQ